MLRSVLGLRGATLCASDGEIGSVVEFLFDDERWTVRYLVADTGNWLLDRRVLITPVALGHSDWKRRLLHVNLTCEQVERSPGLDTDRPVSRQWETGYFDYYGWPYYWGGAGLWGWSWYPGALLARQADARAQANGAQLRREEEVDGHLRSTQEVTGYRICVTDGELGHVEDFIVDDETWAIHYISIDTRNWLPGKKVLLPTPWIHGVSWLERRVTIDLSREQVRGAPEWDPVVPISREYEAQLHGYYGRPGYWTAAETTRNAA
jgi:hypothetical protein